MSFESIYDEYLEIIKSKHDDFPTNEYYLFIACRFGNIELVKWILYFDTSINLSIHSELPFCIACENNQLELVKWIIKYNKNLNLEKYFYHLLIFVSEEGYLEILNILLDNAPEPIPYVNYDLLFSLAYNNNYIEICKKLYYHYPNIVVNHNNDSMFLNSCQKNDIEFAELFANIRPEAYFINICENNIVHYDIMNSIVIKNNKELPYEKKQKTCLICYDKNVEIITSCRHMYCYDCLEKHYEKNNNKCPYCRKENLENELFNII